MLVILLVLIREIFSSDPAFHFCGGVVQCFDAGVLRTVVAVCTMPLIFY